MDADFAVAVVEATDDAVHALRVDLVFQGHEADVRPDLHVLVLVAQVIAESAEHLLPILQNQQGRHCTVDGPVADGRIQVQVTAPTAWMLAQQLAGWGAGIEVTEPSAVRAELARIGTELVDRYGL